MRLYHYTSASAAKAIFDSKRLRFSSTKSIKLNDDSQISKRLAILLRQVESAQGFKALSTNARKSLLRYASLFPDEYFISCFSRTCKNEHLWENYADNRTGACIEFKFPINYPTRVWEPSTHIMTYNEPAECSKTQSALNSIMFPDFSDLERRLALFDKAKINHNITFSEEMLRGVPNYVKWRDILLEAYVQNCLSQKDLSHKAEEEVRLSIHRSNTLPISDSNINQKNGHRYITCNLPEKCFIKTLNYEAAKDVEE